MRFQDSFSAVLKPNFARKYSLEELVGKHAPRSTQCTALHRSLISKFSSKFNFAFFKKFANFSQMLLFFRQIYDFSPQISRILKPEFREILNHFQNSMNFISEQVCFQFSSRIFHFRFRTSVIFDLIFKLYSHSDRSAGCARAAGELEREEAPTGGSLSSARSRSEFASSTSGRVRAPGSRRAGKFYRARSRLAGWLVGRTIFKN